MKDRTGRKLKVGDFFVYMDSTSEWKRFYIYGKNKYHLVDGYHLGQSMVSFVPINMKYEGNEKDRPWLFFATYMTHLNENLEYKIKIIKYKSK